MFFDEQTWAAIRAHRDTELDPPASPEAIAEFETKYEFAFPEAHREFFLRADGGVVGFARVFGVGPTAVLSLAEELEQVRDHIQNLAKGPIFPFANNWGGSYFCYDLSEQVSARGYPVLFWEHEYSEEPEEMPRMWARFAPDFVGFVKRVLREESA